MDQAESPGNSYPDPDVRSSSGPFYSNHQQMSAAGAPLTHVTHAPMANMQGSHNNGRDMQQHHHYLTNFPHGQPSTPQQLAQQSLAANTGGGNSDSSAKEKKNKTSRACDECRRKKVFTLESHRRLHQA